MEESQIGEFVRKARKEKGMSQLDLGKAIGITKEGISRLEIRGGVSNHYREKINEVLSINIPLKPLPAYKLRRSLKQMEAIQFGRWLLKHCTPVFEDQFLTWAYGEGKHLDTLELYDEFKKKDE